MIKKSSCFFGYFLYFHYRNFVWDVPSGERIVDLVDYNYGLTFSPDNSLAATAKEGKVYIYSTDGWVLKNSFGFSDPYRQARPLAFSQDGQILAIEDRYNIVFLETSTGKELYALPGECEMRFSPLGDHLLTWCYQNEIQVFGVIP